MATTYSIVRPGAFTVTVGDDSDNLEALWVKNAIEQALSDRSGITFGSLKARLDASDATLQATKAKTSSAFISVTEAPYNAKGDGSDDTVAIQTAIDYAKTVSGVVIFPYGMTFSVSELAPYAGVTLMGYGATLKMLPNQPKYTRILDATKAGSIYSSDVDSPFLVIKGLTFDGNYDNQKNPDTNLPWNNDYSLEQNMLTIFGADHLKKGRLRVIIEDCLFQNSTSDGVHIYRNCDATITNCHTWNCWRGGIVNSGGYSRLKLSNCTLGGDKYPTGVDIEGDATGYGGTYRTDIVMNNVIMDGQFDIELRDGAWGMFHNVIQYAPNFAYNANGTAHGRFTNCRFYRKGTSQSTPGMYFPGDTVFENCEFVAWKDPLDATVITHAAINLYFNLNAPATPLTGQKVVFRRCKFLAENKGASDTFYGVASYISDPIGWNNWAKFEDCSVTSDFDRLYYMASGGNIWFHNLTCDAVSVASLNYGSTALERFRIKYTGFLEGAFTNYIRLGRSFDIADTVENHGIYLDSSKNVFYATSGIVPTTVTTVGNRVIVGAAAPGTTTPGLVGDVYRLKVPVAGQAYEWIATTNSKTGATWVVARTLGT